jgi:hypothetical protein
MPLNHAPAPSWKLSLQHFANEKLLECPTQARFDPRNLTLVQSTAVLDCAAATGAGLCCALGRGLSSGRMDAALSEALNIHKNFGAITRR